MKINPVIPESGPTFSDMCDQLGGCLNGDIFKFGPVIAGVLIAAEILFWVSLTILVVKRVKRHGKDNSL